MPYATTTELPDAVKELPAHAQDIYMKAFNSAYEQYDGDEEKSHATAWAAVKTKYEKQGDDWVAKESLSFENRRNLLEQAIIAQIGLGDDCWIWVEDMTETEVVYNHERQTFKADYVIGDDNAVVLGAPVQVTRQVVFTPIEALQKAYANIIHEVGKRNANMDAARIKKIVALCQELLDDEEADEKQTKEALDEAAGVLAWLHTLEPVRRELEVRYPREAFAYTPSDNPDSWLLRLWGDAGTKATKAQLKVAAAYLSEGGYSGQHVDIPAESLPEVKRRVRLEYINLGVPRAEMPKSVQATETRELVLSYIPLTEATIDKGRATVTIIKAGFNATGDRYYPAEMLKRDYGIFEGQKMYADHPTDEEDQARPERSIKDWVATLVEVKCDDEGTVTGIAEVVEPWLMTKLATLRDKAMLYEMGISINAIGTATEATIQGKTTMVIEELSSARSVDFVTEPGAGGVVTFYESDRQRDVDLIDLSGLRERRPELVKAIEADIRAEVQLEVKHIMEDKDLIAQLQTDNATLTTERDDYKGQVEEAEKDKRLAEAAAEIKKAVDEADGLPDAAKTRLLKKFEGAESADGVAEAIQEEKDYIAALSESVKIRNFGPPGDNTEAEKTALRESFKAAHPEWSDEQVETAVKG